jgi:DNA repair protein RadC
VGGWIDADEDAADGAGEPAGPSNAGHRQRLRQRALNAGLIALADYELLELFLFRSIPQKDVKPVAKALLDRFGGIEAVLSASREDIEAVKATCLNPRTGKTERRGAGAEGALDLKLMHEAVQRIARAKIEHRPVIGSWTALLAYVRDKFAADKREQFHALFLDTRNRLIRDETLNRGTVDHAPAYPREIATRALEVGASAVILVHNHPSGDPTPSRADIETTRSIVDACRPLKIAVHDHLVVGREGVASFKALGLF